MKHEKTEPVSEKLTRVKSKTSANDKQTPAADATVKAAADEVWIVLFKRVAVPKNGDVYEM